MPMNLDHIRKKEVFSEDVFLKIGIFKVSNLISSDVFAIQNMPTLKWQE